MSAHLASQKRDIQLTLNACIALTFVYCVRCLRYITAPGVERLPGFFASKI